MFSLARGLRKRAQRRMWSAEFSGIGQPLKLYYKSTIDDDANSDNKLL